MLSNSRRGQKGTDLFEMGVITMQHEKSEKGDNKDKHLFRCTRVVS